jgi:hypothetical protein
MRACVNAKGGLDDGKALAGKTAGVATTGTFSAPTITGPVKGVAGVGVGTLAVLVTTALGNCTADISNPVLLLLELLQALWPSVLQQCLKLLAL